MKIVALYKVHGCEEFLNASIKSIYNFVSKIIIVNSQIKWNGIKIPLDKTIFNDILNSDIESKIVILNYDTEKQSRQYFFGLKHINKNLEYDYILIIDSDEVWESKCLQSAINEIKKTNKSAYKCEMITYIKSFNYVVHPKEPCNPCVFIKKGVTFVGIRGNKIKDMYKFSSDIYFHHFTLIRKDLNKIKEKIILSNLGDEQIFTDVNNWINTVWNKIPDVKDFHITERYKHCWQSIREIELPFEIKAYV